MSWISQMAVCHFIIYRALGALIQVKAMCLRPVDCPWKDRSRWQYVTGSGEDAAPHRAGRDASIDTAGLATVTPLVGFVMHCTRFTPLLAEFVVMLARPVVPLVLVMPFAVAVIR